LNACDSGVAVAAAPVRDAERADRDRVERAVKAEPLSRAACERAWRDAPLHYRLLDRGGRLDGAAAQLE